VTRPNRLGCCLWTAAAMAFLNSSSAWAEPVTTPQLTTSETIGTVAQPRDMAAEIDREIEILQGRQGGLTAAKAAEIAVSGGFDSIAAEQRELAADSEVEAAKIRYTPKLNLSAGYTRLSSIDPPVIGTLVAAPGAVSDRPIGANQLLVAHSLSFPVLVNQTTLRAQLIVPIMDYFVRFPQLLDAAKDGKSVAHLSVVAQRARISADARIAYYSWSRAVLQHVTATQAHERTKTHFVDTQRLLEAGLATSADVRSVEAQVAQAELLETRAANAEAITLEQVRIQLRLPVDAKIEIGERVIDVPALPAPMTLDVAWAEAQRSRPELLALAQNEQLLRHQADAASGAELPRVDAFGEILTANPNSRYQPAVDAFKTTWALGVQATWSVNDFPANAAARRGLVAQANAVAAQSNAMKQALRAELVSSLRGVAQARSTIAAASRGVQAAEAAYGVRKDLYLAGRAKSVELTDSETELTRARIDYIDALIDARIATVRLEHALARDVK